MSESPMNPAGQVEAIIWTTDRALHFTSSQGAALSAAGQTGDSYIGTSLYDFFQTKDPEFPPLAAHLHALEGTSTQYVAETWGRWWESHVSPLHDANGEIVGTVGVALDTTARRQAETTLREREEQYRSIFEATSDGLSINDLETGLVLEANPAFHHMHGYDNMVGMHPTKFIHPDYWSVFEEYMQVVTAGQEYRTRAQDVRSDGTVFDVEVLGQVFLYQGRPAVLGVVRDVTEHVRSFQLLEERVAERTREIQRLYEQAQRAAALEERQRIARELHDAVTQTLFSTALIAEVLPRMWDVDPVEGRKRLDEVRRLTRGALGEMRALLLELRPGALSELPLSDSLRQLAEAITGRTSLEVTVTVDGEPDGPLPPEVQVALYRIAQEGLNNVAKHAQAQHARLALHYQAGGALDLRIGDDGIGFDPAHIPAGHLGIGIMRERAQAIGASLHVDSLPDQGTRVVVQWPEPSGRTT
jgi:PAS domain S-box-containing protein